MRSCQGMGVEKVRKDDTARTFEFLFRFNRVWINSRLLLLVWEFLVLENVQNDTKISLVARIRPKIWWIMHNLDFFQMTLIIQWHHHVTKMCYDVEQRKYPACSKIILILGKAKKFRQKISSAVTKLQAIRNYPIFTLRVLIFDCFI